MRIKTLFALLVDNAVHNFSRKLAFDINCKYNTGMIAARLPQHVSLGPGFEIDVLELYRVKQFLESIAKTIKPFKIQFKRISLKVVPNDHDGLGIIWMDVQESKELQELHERLYSEISSFGWKMNWLSGEKYLFHSTISYGGQLANKYQEIYNDLPEKNIDLTSNVEQIAIFCPPDDQNVPGTYITYKILQLGI